MRPLRPLYTKIQRANISYADIYTPIPHPPADLVNVIVGHKKSAHWALS